MARSEAHHKLLYELGDQARDRLAERHPPLPGMLRVFEAEEAVVARRGEVEELEDQLNQADAAYRDFLAEQEKVREELEPLVKRYRKAVDAIEGKVKDLRKKLGTARAESRINRDALKGAESRMADIAMSSDPIRVEQSKLTLKRMRVGLLRKEREIGDMEASMRTALTPEPGQPGSQGIDAHRRILEMEDQAELKKEELDRRVAELDALIAEKDADRQDAEADLADALLLLGEECYAQRLPDSVLTPFYGRLDKLK